MTVNYNNPLGYIMRDKERWLVSAMSINQSKLTLHPEQCRKLMMAKYIIVNIFIVIF